MESYLQQLENNEAILLMYINDELPPPDRIEVEQMLASDAILRAELETLRQAQQAALAALESLDRSVAMPVAPAVAMRQIVREMNRRKLAVKARPPAVVAARRMPWWSWALPTAAAAMLGFVVWTVYHPSNTLDTGAGHRGGIPSPGIATGPPPRQLSEGEKFALLQQSFKSTAEDNADDVSLSVVASRSVDMDFSLDMTHGSESDSQ